MEKMTHQTTLVFFGLLFSFFMLYLMPSYQAEVSKIAGTTVQPLDARLSYTKNDVLHLFETVKPEGREKIAFVSGIVDMIYPLVYGAFFFLLLTKLTHEFSNNRLKNIRFLPLVGMLFDYVENFNVLSMLSNYPSITDKQVFISSSATSLKWLFLGVAIILILVLGGRILFKKKGSKRT